MAKILKLTTGEEIVAKAELVYVEEHEEHQYKLEKPVRLILSEQGVGMMPFAPFLKSEDVTISKSHVIYCDEADDEVANAYNSKFGSGLVVPPSDLKLVK